MHLTKEQTEIVAKALALYVQAKAAVDATGTHLNDLCVAIAGPDYQLQPGPDGGFLLTSQAERGPQPVDPSPKPRKRPRR